MSGQVVCAPALHCLYALAHETQGLRRRMRILFVVTLDDYVRNYLRTGVITSLANEHQVSIGGDENLGLLREAEKFPEFSGVYSTDAQNDKRHRLLLQLYMWRYRSRSRTFYYRWQGMAKWSLLLPAGTRGERFLNVLRWLRHVTTQKKVWRIPLLGNRLVFPLSSRILKGRLHIPVSLRQLVTQSPVDLMIFPSSGYESAGLDLVRLGKELGIKTLCLVDNWDNLTSKTIFWAKPDFLAVWGPQITEQAVRIHGFSEDQVFEIGSPRFESYFSSVTKPSPKNKTKPYVLFVGSAMAFDELTALHTLESQLEDNGLTPDDIQIVYRPHPWQQPRRSEARFDPSHFRYTTLDPQMAELFPEGAWPQHSNKEIQPDLDYYPQLLRGAKLVVGPLTTMLLEAALCLRPVIGLGYGDGLHFNTARRYFTHFDDTEKIPGFFLCEDPQELGDIVKLAIRHPPITEAESDLVTQHFVVHSGTKTYEDRLTELVREISSE
jgi:hypothetical protein